MSDDAFPLARYDAMCTAIAACHSVDEVKDLRDKAMALAIYNRQARNFEAERRASDVRLRAERRAGELLRDMARATPQQVARSGGHAKAATSNAATQQPSAYAQALEDNGITRQTAHRYQALADVPEDVFESHLANPDQRASTSSIIAAAAEPPKMAEDVLWLWGRVREFERNGILDADPITLLQGMTPSMRADVDRVLPRLLEFLGRFEGVTA